MSEVRIERTPSGLEVSGPAGHEVIALPADAEAAVLHEDGIYVAVVGREAAWLRRLPAEQGRAYGLALLDVVRALLVENGVAAARAAGLLYVSQVMLEGDE